MAEAQLSNPRGAFGYQSVDSTGSNPFGQSQNYPPVLVNVYRNASTVDTIQPGMPVIQSTLSSRGDFVRRGLAADVSSPLFLGIALTSAGLNTTATTVATAAGLGGAGSDWLQVQEDGIFIGALLSSVAVAGDILGVSGSTGTTP